MSEKDEEIKKVISETEFDNWDKIYDDEFHHGGVWGRGEGFKSRYLPTFNLDADYTTNVPTLVDWIARVNYRLNLIEKKINQLIDEILKIIDRLNKIEIRLNSIEKRLDVIEKRLDVIDGDIKTIKSRLDSHDKQLKEIVERQNTLENRITKIENDNKARDNALNKIIKNLEDSGFWTGGQNGDFTSPKANIAMGNINLFGGLKNDNNFIRTSRNDKDYDLRGGLIDE